MSIESAEELWVTLCQLIIANWATVESIAESIVALLMAVMAAIILEPFIRPLKRHIDRIISLQLVQLITVKSRRDKATELLRRIRREFSHLSGAKRAALLICGVHISGYRVFVKGRVETAVGGPLDFIQLCLPVFVAWMMLTLWGLWRAGRIYLRESERLELWYEPSDESLVTGSPRGGKIRSLERLLAPAFREE